MERAEDECALPEVDSGPLLPVPSTSSREHELRWVEGLRRYESMQASVASAYAGLGRGGATVRSARRGRAGCPTRWPRSSTGSTLR